MLAGALELDFLTNVARLTKDMGDATRVVASASASMEKAMSRVKLALGELGIGLSIGALVSFVSGALEAADALEKLSQRTGLSTESLSQWQYAAKIADVSNETLTIGMKKLAVSISQGIAGDQLKIAMFKQLGITTSDLGKGTEAVMLKMSDAYAHAKDGAGKTAISIGLMGKAGDEMIPLLNGGSQAIIDLKTEADRLGLTISTEFAEQASQFEDNLKRLHASSGKLAIILATDLVESTGKAMKAFADATIEGNKLAGIISFIQTLFTGDDQHKANVTLVEDTDKLLRAQNDLDRLKRQGYSDDSMAVVHQKQLISGLKSEIDTTLTYKHALDGQADAAKAAAEAVKRQREEGKELQAISKQALADAKAQLAEFNKINRAIAERTNAERMEAASYGRALSEAEKFAAKIDADVKYAKVALSDAQKEAIAAKMAELKVEQDKAAVMKAEHQNAAAFAKEFGNTNQEQADFDKARADEGYRVIEAIRQQKLTLDDSNATLQMEAALLGASDRERETLIGQLQIQLALTREIDKLKHDDMLTKDDREKAISDAKANAERAKGLVAFKAQTAELSKFWTNAFGGMEDALTTFVMTGKLSFTSLIDSMISDLVRLMIRQSIIAPFAKSLADSGFMSGFPNMLGFGGGSAFSPGGVAGSGFGTGLAFGNQDFGGFFADGGFLPAGKWGIAGERGPEPIYGGSTGVTVQSNGGGQTVYNYNFTVGDVATVSMVKQAVASSEQRTVGGLMRSRQYGGAAA